MCVCNSRLYSSFMEGGTDRKSKETNFLICALYLGNNYPESNLWTVCIKEEGRERKRERERDGERMTEREREYMHAYVKK